MPIAVDAGLFGQTQHSGTENSVSEGLKTFTLDIDDGYLQTDYTVQIVSTADPECWMYGIVTSSSAPDYTVSIFKVSAVTGTFTDWNIQVIAGPFAGLPASQTLGFSTDTASVPAVGTALSWTAEAGKTFYDNSTVYVSAVTDPTAFFFATVVSYNSGTGAIKLVANRASGSGTYSLWTISLIDVSASFRTTVGDAGYSIKASDRNVALTSTLTAARIWVLPAANTVPPGTLITVNDEVGGIVDSSKYIGLQTSPLDTLNQFAWPYEWPLSTPFGSWDAVSNGVDGWKVSAQQLGQFARIDVTESINVIGSLAAGSLNLTSTLNGRDPDDFVTGPASVTADRVAAFNGTTGKIIKDGGMATSSVVTLTGAQTLTNKTLTTPTVTSPTIDGTISNTSGNLTVTSNVDLNLTATDDLVLTASGDDVLITAADDITFSGDAANFLGMTSVVIPDSALQIRDEADTSKILKFQISGFTTATTRTVTWPDASITVVGTTNTQTLTNKTLTSPVINSGTYTGDIITAGAIRSTAALLGYTTGAGGTVTQGAGGGSPSKSDAVTLNTACGAITTASEALAAGAVVVFQLNNSLIGSSDCLIVNHRSGGTRGNYLVQGHVTSSGVANISIRNMTAGSLSNALVINFCVINGSSS